MFSISILLLACTLVLSGGYAGLLLMCQIGIVPAMRRLSLPAYADAFRALDSLMGRRMPPYKVALLLFSIGALVTAALAHRRALAWCLGISLALNVADLLLNVRIQIPLNKQLQALPADASNSTLQAFLRQTSVFFAVRFCLSFTAFTLLCFGALFTPYC